MKMSQLNLTSKGFMKRTNKTSQYKESGNMRTEINEKD